MSKVSITGNASGTGTFTIAAPNSNTDRTFNLPDEAGTVITSASDIEAQVKTATNATGSAPIYACRAWVNFNGTGTVAIRASGNVSSITDNGTGNYTVNFTTAMPDANYSVSGACEPASNRTCILMINDLAAPTASALRIFSAYSDASLNRVAFDSEFTNVAIFR